MMKALYAPKVFQYWKAGLLIISLLFCHGVGLAQNRISGVVLDDAKQPVIGANVLEKGTLNAASTDLEGKFTITVAPGATLTISFIGYLSKEVTVGNQTSFTITYYNHFF